MACIESTCYSANTSMLNHTCVPVQNTVLSEQFTDCTSASYSCTLGGHPLFDILGQFNCTVSVHWSKEYGSLQVRGGGGMYFDKAAQ